MIIERGQIAPALVAADLDHSRAEHDSENKRAKKPDDDERRRAARERPAVEQRTEKNGEETGLEELHFPAVAVPFLADVHERHVENPEESEEKRVGVTAGHHAGERETDPGRDDQRGVGMIEPEERRQPEKSA